VPDLDSDAAAHLTRLLALGPLPGLEEGTAEQARAAHVASAGALSGPGEPLPDVRDGRVAGVPVRTYRPVGARGTVVYVHGGGWVVGTLDTYDPLCRSLALLAGATVVSVDYDLAPEARHPRQAEQVEAVLRALAGDGPLALAGDSVGAHLGALAATRGTGALAGLALVYPVVGPALDTPSAVENATGYGLTTAAMRWFWAQYLPRVPVAAGAGDPLPVDLLAADLARLPATLVLTAGRDPLRDEGLALADALAAAGVQVRRLAYDGQIHGFFRMGAVVGQALTAQREVAAFLRDRLDGGARSSDG